MKIRTAMTVAVLALTPTLALAQNTIREGAENGAVVGRDAAGPIVGVVGGTVGAAVGTAAVIPDAVITSVRGERADSVVIQERVAVGEPLPGTVELRPVPKYAAYRYAVVNNQRLIVDPQTRRVIRVID